MDDAPVDPVSPLRAFVDASVLMPAAISSRGSSRDLIDAGARGQIELVVSQNVLAETERNLYRKLPDALRTFWAQRDRLAVVDPSYELVISVAEHIEPKDAPVVAGAIAADAEYLVSYDRRHLLGEADLIYQLYRIQVVTPDYLVARIANLDPR